ALAEGHLPLHRLLLPVKSHRQQSALLHARCTDRVIGNLSSRAGNSVVAWHIDVQGVGLARNSLRIARQRIRGSIPMQVQHRVSASNVPRNSHELRMSRKRVESKNTSVVGRKIGS